MHHQTVRALDRDGGLRLLELPAAEEAVVPGIRWGRFEQFFTPAFWAARTWAASLDGSSTNYRLGRTLPEEFAACVLGGHGIRAEVGLDAFHRVREAGLLTARPQQDEIVAILNAPSLIGGRAVRYRFARQKAAYLASGLAQLGDFNATVVEDDTQLRAALMQLEGVGPKTASWIVRNWLGSDRVAILDVHIVRACVAMKLFHADCRLPRDYLRLEELFLGFAGALGAQPSVLDNVMWQTMRSIGHLATGTLH